jgi:hypothetical protein
MGVVYRRKKEHFVGVLCQLGHKRVQMELREQRLNSRLGRPRKQSACLSERGRPVFT